MKHHKVSEIELFRRQRECLSQYRKGRKEDGVEQGMLFDDDMQEENPEPAENMRIWIKEPGRDMSLLEKLHDADPLEAVEAVMDRRDEIEKSEGVLPRFFLELL